MPSTTVVVACVFALAALIAVIFFARSRAKAAQPEAPRFEPPREIVKRSAPEQKEEAAKEPANVEPSPPSSLPEPTKAAPPQELPTPPVSAPPAPAPAPVAEVAPKEASPTEAKADEPSDAMPASTEEVVADQILEAAPAAKKTPAVPGPPPPLPQRESKPGAPRPPMRSYSNISDESVAEELKRESATPSQPKPLSEPKVAAKPLSEPKVAAPKPPASEPKPKLPVSEPKAAVAKPLPTSEAKIAAPKSEPKVAAKPADEHDFSALSEPVAAKPAVTAAAATAAKFIPPPNPETADLEKNDPRHAAARRLARVSVSEIKLYHEDEVKAGREAKDLWKRLQQDITLAKQTFEGRVAAEVRERFDYLYDEILRQLAEGDVSKLGPDAPAPKRAAPKPSDTATTATITAPPAADAPPAGEIDPEAPTRTVGRTLEPLEADAPAEKPKPAAEKPKPIEAPAAAKPAEPAKPTGIAARALPSNPETAELEKNDPRHAAARRLARLSVSEIKLYHEDEVKAGREAKDLWTRLIADINLAKQTFEKRVDKEVRDRFDYLYDEILRQLAEGDVTKLGPDAPKPKKTGDGAVAPTAAVAPTVAAAPTAVAAPADPPPAAAAAPAAKIEPPPAKPEAAAPAPAAASPAAASVAARYAPPTNPATAELEKNDPRHAAARRLARLSVSEIKLYHEDEVKAGREAKDLWKRLTTDIGLATQTYEKRVDKEVRARFDYLYDEILRQLAEGDVAKLGPEAPKPKVDA